MAIQLQEDDIFIIHGYGDRDKRPLFLRIDQNGEYKWTPNRCCASELSRDEAVRFIEEGEKAGRKSFAIRCVGSIS